MTRKPAAVLLVLCLAVLAVALVPAAGLAAKGGNSAGGGGGKPGGGSGTTATLWSSCNPCAVGTVAHFSGSGYDASQPRGMAAIADGSGNTTWVGVNVSSDGTTSFDLYMSPAGTYDIKVLQSQHKQLVVKATLTGLIVN